MPCTTPVLQKLLRGGNAIQLLCQRNIRISALETSGIGLTGGLCPNKRIAGRIYLMLSGGFPGIRSLLYMKYWFFHRSASTNSDCFPLHCLYSHLFLPNMSCCSSSNKPGALKLIFASEVLPENQLDGDRSGHFRSRSHPCRSVGSN